MIILSGYQYTKSNTIFSGFVHYTIIFIIVFFFLSSVENDAIEKLQPFANLTGDESYQSRDLEKVTYQVVNPSSIIEFPLCVLIVHVYQNVQVSQQVAKQLYDAKVQPSTLLPKQIGNMYTASLYAALASVIHNKHTSLVLCAFSAMHYYPYSITILDTLVFICSCLISFDYFYRVENEL